METCNCTAVDFLPDETHCPYCGGAMVTPETELCDNTDAVLLLHTLGEMVERLGKDGGNGVAAALLRCLYPDLPGRQIAAKLGLTPASHFRLYRRVFQVSPLLGMYIRGSYTKTRGVCGGKHKMPSAPAPLLAASSPPAV